MAAASARRAQKSATCERIFVLARAMSKDAGVPVNRSIGWYDKDNSASGKRFRQLGRHKIMTHKFPFLIATTIVAIGSIPQIAHASCSGSACPAFSYESNKFTNKDKDLKIHLTGCFLQANGTCAASANFDITIDPNSSKSVTPPPALGSNAKVDVKTAAFVGALTHPHVQTLPNGNTALVEIAAVAVNNGGKLPLKVVILDADFKELGRTSDYKTGSFSVELKTHVSKYHWEVFAPGDVEPCQKLRDETKNSISVGCDHTKAPEKLPPLPPLAQVAQSWAEKCQPNGAGGPMETCCSRQRRAETHCTRQPVFLNVAEDCDNAERLCRGLVKK
jgi:hypothetical protein